MFWLVAPWPRELGLVEVTVGAVTTVKQPAQVPVPVSGLVAVALRAPVVAVGLIVTLAVSWVELLNVVELTVMPVPEKVTAAPLTKSVPVTATFWVVLRYPKSGLVEVTVGAAFTVKQPEHEPVPVSGLVTVTSRAPVVAPAEIVRLAVSWVELLNVVELTVMPVPERVTAAPFWKLVPATVTFPVKPCGRELGLVELTVGAATVTVVFGLSAPDQLPCTGVTEYFQTPFGTLVSVQVRPAITTSQLGPMT